MRGKGAAKLFTSDKIKGKCTRTTAHTQELIQYKNSYEFYALDGIEEVYNISAKIIILIS